MACAWTAHSAICSALAAVPQARTINLSTRSG